MPTKRGDVALVLFPDNLATILAHEIDRVVGNCPVMDQVSAALRTLSL